LSATVACAVTQIPPRLKPAATLTLIRPMAAAHCTLRPSIHRIYFPRFSPHSLHGHPKATKASQLFSFSHVMAGGKTLFLFIAFTLDASWEVQVEHPQMKVRDSQWCWYALQSKLLQFPMLTCQIQRLSGRRQSLMQSRCFAFVCPERWHNGHILTSNFPF
jgi:hypothetical protein